MNRYENTTIWQKSLGKQLEHDIYEKERELIRVEFEKFREKAKTLAAEIARLLPEYTVHDIGHIDALWETAELIARDDCQFTPAEAFVLGGTFLIHDLGMGLASFPNGIDELKKENMWKDTVASILKKKFNRELKEEDLLSIDIETEKAATENVLRLLHAKHAEKLALVSWKDNNKNDVFLIENTELRESYGSIIGLIAHSHWWPVEELEGRLPKTLGAPGIFPSDWTIDAVKLACILRIADATQIDDRRAPSFLRTIRKPTGYSDLHWNFQQKLYQPRLERNRLVYTSKSPFLIDEVDSWWICYDTLQMIDNELKEVDSLLVDTNRQRLKAIGIASMEDPRRLSKLIGVEGWQPVDTKIKVTDVAKLVGNLGGKELYGDNSIVPLRELIQNASDAIRARRLIENEGESFGNIILRFGKDDNGHFIEIEDNGIGMSSKVLIGPFLDFGVSFWGTPLMHEELPGLEAKGFNSTGKYGIGFFSVFMWGDKVTVTTKRYENGRDSTLMLEFNKGASSRPILRKANIKEVIKDGGTRIRVWFSSVDVIENLLKRNSNWRTKVSFEELIETLCPSIDCNITIEEKGKMKNIIKANDWITIPALTLIKRILGKSVYKALSNEKKQILISISRNMELLKEVDGKIVGRLALYDDSIIVENDMPFKGVVTIGGLKSSELNSLIGVLVGRSDRASRDVGIPLVQHTILEHWASNQSNLLSKLSLPSNVELHCASVVRRCGGNTSTLKIAHHKSGILDYNGIKAVVENTNSDTYIIVHDAKINLEVKGLGKIDFLENVFWVNVGSKNVFHNRDYENYIDWPSIDKPMKDWFHAETLKGLVEIAISEVWGDNIKRVLSNSNISTDDKEYSAHVGYIAGKELVFDHIDIIKKPQKK